MVDILLAAYNGELYIEEQMVSIIGQTKQPWRLIIHDDCSDDGTYERAMAVKRSFDACHEDSRCSIVVEKNTLPTGCTTGNILGLLQNADSDYIMFCDQDDVWHEDKVEKTLRYMKKLEKRYGKSMPLLVFTDLAVVDAQLKELAPSFIDYMNLPKSVTLNRLMIQNNVTGCTVMINKTLAGLLRYAKDLNRIVMHDHFAAMIACVFGKSALLPQATMDYRQHGSNVVGAANARSISYLWRRYRRGKAEFRKDLRASMDQTAYFLELYGELIEDSDKKKLLSGYAHLYEKNKLQRIFYYVKNGVLKHGWIRLVMQLVWG